MRGQRERNKFEREERIKTGKRDKEVDKNLKNNNKTTREML